MAKSKEYHLAPAEAINLHCMECGGLEGERFECTSTGCFFYSFRHRKPLKLGRIFFEADGSRKDEPVPKIKQHSRKLTPEQRKAATERLRRAREARDG